MKIKVILLILNTIIYFFSIALGIIITTMLIITYILNRYYSNVISNQSFNFATDNRRNFTHLIIGNKDTSQQYNNSLKFIAPQRSLYASYIIIQTYYSLLQEDGISTIHITYSNKYISNLSLLDFRLMHPITKAQLGYISKSHISDRFPFLHVLHSICNYRLRSKSSEQYKITSLKNEIIQFCSIRNISIKFYDTAQL